MLHGIGTFSRSLEVWCLISSWVKTGFLLSSSSLKVGALGTWDNWKGWLTLACIREHILSGGVSGARYYLACSGKKSPNSSPGGLSFLSYYPKPYWLYWNNVSLWTVNSNILPREQCTNSIDTPYSQRLRSIWYVCVCVPCRHSLNVIILVPPFWMSSSSLSKTNNLYSIRSLENRNLVSSQVSHRHITAKE